MTAIEARKNWDHAEDLWQDAMKQAGGDEQHALGLLLAKIYLKLEDAERRAFQGRVR
jgi:hypothetical protein